MTASGVLDYARQYKERGWAVVPIKKGEKYPTTNGWKKFTAKTPLPDLNLSSDSNIGVHLGKPSGGLVDFDIDDEAAIPFVVEYMPMSALAFSRPSKMLSHILYQIDGECTITRVPYSEIGENKPMLVEIRGTDHQTMMPGSTHPNGELVIWADFAQDGQAQATLISEDELKFLAGVVAWGAFLSKKWMHLDHQRHECTLHIVGVLLRAGRTEEWIERFIRVLCDVAGDPDVRDRVNAVKSTAERYRNGEKTTGARQLATIFGKEQVDRMRGWIGSADSAIDMTPTDVANAQRFVAEHGDVIRFQPEGAQWWVYNGKYWETIDSKQMVGLAMQTSRTLAQEAIRVEDPKLRLELSKWANSSQMVERLNAMVTVGATFPEIHIKTKDIDSNPWLFPCANGIYDIQEQTLKPHSPEFFLTGCSPVEYNPDAQCPKFLKFMSQIMPDQETIDWMQRFIGYSMTGSIREQIAGIFYGRGKNGKTTLLEVIRGVTGTYAEMADISTFTASNRRSAGSATGDIARLHRARIVSAVEPDSGSRISTSLVKQMTGGEPIVARNLNHSEFVFKPRFTLIFLTNHKLPVSDTDEGIWRRLRYIPFLIEIPEAMRIKDYHEVLLTEESEGMLAYFLHGATAWLRQGLPALPESVREINEDTREDMDVLGSFLADTVQVSADNSVMGSMLYQEYETWCHRNGQKPMANNRLAQELKGRGFEKTRRVDGVHWVGVKLKGQNVNLPRLVNS